MNRKIFLISLPALAFSVHRLSAATRPFVYDTATGKAPSVDRLYRDFYIYVDMSPSPSYHNTSGGTQTLINDFYYKDADGALKRTVSSSGAEKKYYGDRDTYQDIRWWTDFEVKVIDKWGNTLYFSSTIALKNQTVINGHSEIIDKTPKVYYLPQGYDDNQCFRTKTAFTDFTKSIGSKIGNTIYVDLNGATGVQDIYKCFAKALKLGYSSPSRLKDRIFDAINERMLIIIDEFHQITFAYRKGSSCAMVHAIKAIHDICKCGMVICSTNIGRTEVERGHDAKLCSQLLKRGTIQLQLPNVMPIEDVRAIVEAYKLKFPEAKRGELWRNFRGENKGQNYCHDIACEKGINYLILCLQDGNIMASKQNRALEWRDFERAHETYLALAQPKQV